MKTMKLSTYPLYTVNILFWVYLLLALSGCAPAAFVTGAAAGAGTYAYVGGISRAAYPVPFDRMWNETAAMLEQQQIGIVDRERQEDQGTIRGTHVDGRDVRVDLSAEGPQVTRVDIRVGLVPPDRDAAEDLHRVLARRVGVELPI